MSGDHPLSWNHCMGRFSALAGVFLLLALPISSGQNISFSAAADVKEAIVGLPFEVTFTLQEAEGQRFIPPAFSDFKLAGGVSESRGMSILNGRTSSRQSWTYTLEAQRPGTFTIGPAKVAAGNKILSTAPLAIKVLPASAASKGGLAIPPGRDDQVFIAGSLNATKAYPGQQLVWRLVLYTRVAIEGADLISLPDFEGFYTKERRKLDTRTQYQTIKGKKYALRTLHEEAVFPQSTGQLTIGSAQIRVGIEQPGAQGFLFGPKPVTLTSLPVTLEVLPLPQPAAEGFTGVVGRYDWELKADSADITTDDALTLTIALKGNGDARRFAPPKLEAPEHCEIFDPRIVEEEEHENEQEIVHSKTLEYILLPKEPGTYEFAPKMVYFDPDSNKYCAIQAPAIHFAVTAGKNYQPPHALDTLPVAIRTPGGIKMFEKITGWIFSPAAGMALAAIALSFSLYLFVKRRRDRPEPAPLLAHPPSNSEKVQMALHRFANAGTLLMTAPPEVFYNELLKSLQTYIANKLNLSPAQINQAVLKSKMAEKRVTPIRVQAFLSIMQTCEQAVFSGQSDPASMESDWRTAQAIVQELEKEMP